MSASHTADRHGKCKASSILCGVVLTTLDRAKKCFANTADYLELQVLGLSCQLGMQLCNLSFQAGIGGLRMLPPVLALCQLLLQARYRLCLLCCRHPFALQILGLFSFLYPPVASLFAQ